MPFSLITPHTDLPCLLSLTSCQHILVHSLPYLEPLLHLHFPLLSDIRYTCIETWLVLHMPIIKLAQEISVEY